MVRALWPKADTRSVIEPEAAFPRSLLRTLQPLPPPDPLDPLHIHDPACVTQQSVANGRSDQWRNHWQLRR